MDHRKGLIEAVRAYIEATDELRDAERMLAAAEQDRENAREDIIAAAWALQDNEFRSTDDLTSLLIQIGDRGLPLENVDDPDNLTIGEISHIWKTDS